MNESYLSLRKKLLLLINRKGYSSKRTAAAFAAAVLSFYVYSGLLPPQR